jgi:hypothetical protein
MATIECYFCGMNIKALNITIHFPRCYIEHCEMNSVTPLCTCSACGGKQTHHCTCSSASAPASADQTSLPPSPLLTPTTLPPEKKQKQGESAHQTSIAELSPAQLMGKKCILCNMKRTPKTAGIPHIYIGNYQKILLCKKGHLVDTEECSNVQHILTQLITTMKTNGDGNIDIFTNRSEDKAPTDNEDKDNSADGRTKCTGFLTTASKKKCSWPTEHLLFTVEEKKRHFCRPSHLLHHLLIHNCAQGKSPCGGKRK